MTTDRDWWIALTLMTLLVGAALLAQPRVTTLGIGLFGGTDQEILECTFSVGQGAALILHPKGDMCIVARELVGRTGTLLFVPD